MPISFVMDSHPEALTVLRNHQLIATVGNLPGNTASVTAHAALAGGLRAFAIAADHPDCMGLVHQLHQHPQGPIIGISAVFDSQAIHRAYAAGARFVVMYHAHPELIRTARALGMACIASAFTPSEMITAHQAGAHAILLFPVDGHHHHTHFRMLRQALFMHPSSPILGVMGNLDEESIPTYLEESAELFALTTVLSSPVACPSPTDTPAAVGDTTKRVVACRQALREYRPKDQLVVRASTGERILDHQTLSELPASEHISLSALIPGRSGTGVFLRTLLQGLLVNEHTHFRVTSQDGQIRVFRGHRFIRSAVVQFDINLRHKGPFRLFLADGDDKCDNLKHVQVIEELTHHREPSKGGAG